MTYSPGRSLSDALGQSEAARLIGANYLARSIATGEVRPTPDEDAGKILLRLRWLNEDRLAAGFAWGWEQAENLLRPRWKRTVELGRWLHGQGRIESAGLYQWWDTETMPA